MSRKIRVGLVGCGVMGKSLAKELVQLEQAQLVAVCDAVAKRAQEAGQEFGAPSHSEPEQFVTLPELDAILVATPGFAHAPVTVAAARAGKHVFCEKPMAPTLEDCDYMIAACREADVKLMIGQVCRFHAIHRKVRDIVASGELGKLICAIIYRLGGGFSGVWDVPWRKERAKCGGALMELNAHELDWLRFVGGEVASVYAAGGNYTHGDWDYPDVALVTVKFGSGAVGFLHSSLASTIGGYGGRLDCERGSLYFPSFWGQDSFLRIQTADGQKHDLSGEDIKVENPVRQELLEFLQAIIEDREPAVTGHDGRAVVEIALAAYRSIETGKEISLPLQSSMTNDQ